MVGSFLYWKNYKYNFYDSTTSSGVCLHVNDARTVIVGTGL